MLQDMFKKRVLTLVLLLGQIFTADLLLAAEPGGPDLSLDQLLQAEVKSAAQISRQVSDAPSVVYVVTAEDIRAFGYQTLADVLYSLPGLYKTYDYR
jgi:outer membrane receptor for ferrienterochelin and colicin